MNTLNFCLNYPKLCNVLSILDVLREIDNLCLRHPELCEGGFIPANICKICPVCCYSRVNVDLSEKVRDGLLSRVEDLVKIGSLLEEITKPQNVLKEDEVVVFVPVVIKRPKTVSELESAAKSGIIADKKLASEIKRVVL